MFSSRKAQNIACNYTIANYSSHKVPDNSPCIFAMQILDYLTSQQMRTRGIPVAQL